MAARSKKISWYITWAIIDLIVLAILSGFIFSLPIWRIHSVEVIGNNYISKEKITAIARVPMEENIFMIETETIKARFDRTIQIKSVKIIRKLPGTIKIQVEERRPFALVTIGSMPMIVDDDGYVLARKNISASIYRADISKFPVVRGVSKKMLEGGARLSEAERTFLKETVTLFARFLDLGSVQIELSDKDNIIVYIEDILKVKIGGYDDIEKKVKVLKALLDSVKGKWEKVAYIDVRVPDDPVIRFK